MADLFPGAASEPQRIDEHRVRTLPSLLLALADLQRQAERRGARRVDLQDVSASRGALVSLNQDASGRTYIQFEGLGLCAAASGNPAGRTTGAGAPIDPGGRSAR
jgi:hypothetical protein